MNQAHNHIHTAFKEFGFHHVVDGGADEGSPDIGYPCNYAYGFPMYHLRPRDNSELATLLEGFERVTASSVSGVRQQLSLIAATRNILQLVRAESTKFHLHGSGIDAFVSAVDDLASRIQTYRESNCTCNHPGGHVGGGDCEYGEEDWSNNCLCIHYP